MKTKNMKKSVFIIICYYNLYVLMIT